MSDSSAKRPVVGLVMGSDSDWPIMEDAAKVLEEFGIGYEADVISAHRMPQETIAYGQSAAERGLRVIIAGAGGAAAHRWRAAYCCCDCSCAPDLPAPSPAHST